MPEHGPQDSPSLRKRHIAAVMIGGIVEYYDFVVFTFFAIQIVVNGTLFREATSSSLLNETLTASGTWRR